MPLLSCYICFAARARMLGCSDARMLGFEFDCPLPSHARTHGQRDRKTEKGRETADTRTGRGQRTADGRLSLARISHHLSLCRVAPSCVLGCPPPRPCPRSEYKATQDTSHPPTHFSTFLLLAQLLRSAQLRSAHQSSSLSALSVLSALFRPVSSSSSSSSSSGSTR
jgi:hypothetical protein